MTCSSELQQETECFTLRMIETDPLVTDPVCRTMWGRTSRPMERAARLDVSAITISSLERMAGVTKFVCN